MSTEENKALDRRFIDEAWNRGNMAILDELVAPNCVGHAPLRSLHGPDGFKQYVMMFRSAFPDVQMVIEDQVAEGDKLVTRWTARGTHQGPLMGIPATGKQITMSGISIYRVAEGKIVESWGNADILGLLQQLGVIPALGQAS